MWNRVASCVGASILVLGFLHLPFISQAGVLDFGPKKGEPPTLTQVARMIDNIQCEIVGKGSVVIKQPDIWSQARMTKFRKEFEQTMAPELVNFHSYLAGRIARSDFAAFQSETALGATLLPYGAPAGSPAGTPPYTPQITSLSDLNSSLQTLTNSNIKADGTLNVPQIPTATGPTDGAISQFNLLNQTIGSGANGQPPTTMPFGLEPNVNLDEKADYINHLHRIRRVNLGDDNSDSAGYGLYLMRVPVSVQPGHKTDRGYGALVNITMRHDFDPKFLPRTYRNLVINDVVDMLAPVVYELIRSGTAAKHLDRHAALHKAKAKRTALAEEYQGLKASRPGAAGVPGAPEIEARLSHAQLELSHAQSEELRAQAEVDETPKEMSKSKNTLRPHSRTGPRTFAIAPSDVNRVFVPKNLLNLSVTVQQALDLGKSKFPDTNRVRATDVRSYLKHELESAYDLMEGRSREAPPLLMDVDYIENLTDMVYSRKFEGPKGTEPDSPLERDDFTLPYEGFIQRLPGNLRTRPIGVLCWGIALEAGLLNRQLREDMKDTKSAEGYVCPPNIDQLVFYPPYPHPEAVGAFQAYVQARWPMIAFAVEPVVDEQNIEDSYTRRRDLQLAVAFALSAGRITFRQAMRYTRQLQYEAQTIALNQTISGFAHGNDTFGWRITPRFQTPPDESNFRAVTNLFIWGGPGPNYGLKNAKLEPGLREMTAAVVMPSFVPGMRLDVENNWFKLHEQDHYKLHTARSIEIGREINEARVALDSADTCGLYRHEDVERLRVRLHQLEAMLPLQTSYVKVPYENTLGGFALFTQGATALVPELSGYEGIEYLNPNQFNDIIVYGKHFSIYETSVVVGGVELPLEGAVQAITKDANGNPVVVGNVLSPLRSSDGTVLLVTANGTTTPIKDNGSYYILSREVMRVHVPPGIKTATREDGTVVAEVYVSTPNGISNRLQIPVMPGTVPPALVATPSSAPAQTAYTLLDDTLTITLPTTLGAGGAATVNPPQVPPLPGLRVQAYNLPSLPSDAINLSMKFTIAGTQTQLDIPALRRFGDMYVADPSQLSTFGTTLFNLLNKNNQTPKPGNPGATPSVPPVNPSLQTAEVHVYPIPRNGVGFPDAQTTNQLTIKFQFILTAPSASAGGGAANTTAQRGSAGTDVSSPNLTPSSPSTASMNGRSDRDPGARRTALEPNRSRISKAAFEETLQDPLPQLPASLDSSVSEKLQTLADQTTALTEKVQALPQQVSAALPRPQVTPTTAHNVVVMPQAPPPINIAVPVTNVPHANHRWPRRGTPANPTRPPLVQRIMDRL
jgi:hypothetical protein